MRTYLIILALIALNNCRGQNSNGIWLSYNNREFIHDSGMITTGNEGFFIDFDENRFGHLGADSTAAIRIDFEKKIFTAVYHEEFEVPFESINRDSIEIDMGGNVMQVFRKLDLTHVIKMSQAEIENFLTKNEIDSVQGYKLDFTAEQYFMDKMFDRPHRKNNVYNKNWEDCGHWQVDKIKGNAFLILAIGQTERKNIFQILSVDEMVMTLKHLQEDRNLENLTEIKTSL